MKSAVPVKNILQVIAAIAENVSTTTDGCSISRDNVRNDASPVFPCKPPKILELCSVLDNEKSSSNIDESGGTSPIVNARNFAVAGCGASNGGCARDLL